MKVDRYRSVRAPHVYVLVAYQAVFPTLETSSTGEFETVGASDTRAYSDALCHEIETTIRAQGY